MQVMWSPEARDHMWVSHRVTPNEAQEANND